MVYAPRVTGVLPSGRSYHTADFVGEDMYVIGGVDFQRETFMDVWVYITGFFLYIFPVARLV